MRRDRPIEWRYTRFADLRASLRGEPGDALRPAERAELGRFRHAGRREQSILARLLAKQMLLATVLGRTRAGNAEPAIEISTRDAAGRSVRPRVTIDGRPSSVNLSIAHSETAVLVAISLMPGVSVGVDLVPREPVTAGFLEAWFQPEEREEIVAENDATAASRRWAVKEALYKAANEDDVFAPRQITVSRGDRGGYGCSYRGLELGERCRVTTWECDEHVAALVTLQRAPGGRDARVRECAIASAVGNSSMQSGPFTSSRRSP